MRDAGPEEGRGTAKGKESSSSTSTSTSTSTSVNIGHASGFGLQFRTSGLTRHSGFVIRVSLKASHHDSGYGQSVALVADMRRYELRVRIRNRRLFAFIGGSTFGTRASSSAAEKEIQS
jgi:hypothetical protein